MGVSPRALVLDNNTTVKGWRVEEGGRYGKERGGREKGFVIRIKWPVRLGKDMNDVRSGSCQFVVDSPDRRQSWSTTPASARLRQSGSDIADEICMVRLEECQQSGSASQDTVVLPQLGGGFKSTRLTISTAAFSERI
jgi:hypothetical protein